MPGYRVAVEGHHIEPARRRLPGASCPLLQENRSGQTQAPTFAGGDAGQRAAVRSVGIPTGPDFHEHQGGTIAHHQIQLAHPATNIGGHSKKTGCLQERQCLALGNGAVTLGRRYRGRLGPQPRGAVDGSPLPGQQRLAPSLLAPTGHAHGVLPDRIDRLGGDNLPGIIAVCLAHDA